MVQTSWILPSAINDSLGSNSIVLVNYIYFPRNFHEKIREGCIRYYPAQRIWPGAQSKSNGVPPLVLGWEFLEEYHTHRAFSYLMVSHSPPNLGTLTSCVVRAEVQIGHSHQVFPATYDLMKE